MFITDDEKTGKQKKTPSVMLVNAETPKQAYERVEISLKSALDPFEITDVNTTKILDISRTPKRKHAICVRLAN